MNKKYDIIIAGGGTAGCAAAYTAGKAGLKTLLVEKNIHLGGAITSGLVIPCMNANNPSPHPLPQGERDKLNNEFFKALIKELKKLGGQVTYQGNKGWFNPELTKIALDNLMKEVNVEVMFSSRIVDVSLYSHSEANKKSLRLKSQDDKKAEESQNKEIKSVKILSEYNDKLQKELSEPIETRYVIDATGNCEIGKLCGCEFLDVSSSLQSGEAEFAQPVSLRFIMSNVDLKAFAEWISEFDKDRNVTTVEILPHPLIPSRKGMGNEIHLSTAYTWDEGKIWALKPLFDDAVAKNVLKDTDRNYFQIFTVAGMPDAVAFNCPRIVEKADYSTTLQEARQAILRLSNFCKMYLKGFENAYISNIADELGIRVSNRIKGKYVYSIDDLKSGKRFEHPVLISNYPVDVHSSKKDSSTLEKTGYYELPVESLMSKDIDNLFVAGRCLSADFMAQGALRIQPNCFSMGEGIINFIIQRLRGI